ncbi:hypothetical protein L6452_08959 [Arctium lappa]|uniref:Uncharacterized protein n=1 Tax=Arctium lappa TaxID=4217 RepID=A0ACB9DJ52_ARCLA|nr:hypothetical protein L6452_08959 [Arctium lappa]
MILQLRLASLFLENTSQWSSLKEKSRKTGRKAQIWEVQILTMNHFNNSIFLDWTNKGSQHGKAISLCDFHEHCMVICDYPDGL